MREEITNTDKLKTNLDTFGSGKSSAFERVDFSLSRSYLHFLPKLSLSLKLPLILHDLCLSRFLPARFTRMRTRLQNQNEWNPSIASQLGIFRQIYHY